MRATTKNGSRGYRGRTPAPPAHQQLEGLRVLVFILVVVIQLIGIGFIQFTAHGEGHRRSHQRQVVLLKHDVSNRKDWFTAVEGENRLRISIILETEPRHRRLTRRQQNVGSAIQRNQLLQEAEPVATLPGTHRTVGTSPLPEAESRIDAGITVLRIHHRPYPCPRCPLMAGPV